MSFKNFCMLHPSTVEHMENSEQSGVFGDECEDDNSDDELDLEEDCVLGNVYLSI